MEIAFPCDSSNVPDSYMGCLEHSLLQVVLVEVVELQKVTCWIHWLAGSVAHSHLLEEMLDNTFITIYIDFSFLSLKSILTYKTVPSRNSHTLMST